MIIITIYLNGTLWQSQGKRRQIKLSAKAFKLASSYATSNIIIELAMARAFAPMPYPARLPNYNTRVVSIK